MDPALARRALDILDDALDWPDDARDARLEKQYSSEPELLTALRAFIRADTHAQGLMATQPAEPRRIEEEQPPERIGPYRLTGLIARGGMGAVYRAERADGLFDHAVAIKLLRPGLFSRTAEVQFARERQILARIRHPHIAQLYDGGVDEAGRSYIVMELLAGQSITAHAAELSLKERVRLILPVCAAAQHAHAQLVVHADIKPTNVIVDETDGVKMLDFGIARSLSEDGVGASAALTPAYASPARLAGEAATTADDVYALGMLLRELIVGAPPMPENVRESAGALLKRLKRKDARAVRGDLDAVVAKAIAPEPADRYVTPASLADDVVRWLETKPVAARPPDWRRNTTFFIRRRHPFHRALSSRGGGACGGRGPLPGCSCARALHDL